MIQLKAENISKNFSDFKIFKDISFEVSSGQCLAITGRNGSGKTTLIRVLSRLIQPSSGKLSVSENAAIIQKENIYKYIGLIGPYLELYQDLTAQENLVFFARMKELKNYEDRVARLMEMIGLKGREHDLVKTYSSGMKQRLKYVAALLAEPEILFVDEPRSNLDEQGIETVYQIFEEQKKDNMLILATNDSDDLQFADMRVDLNV
ncbi:MAG TPA: ABC transporter ATP-binding protein [Caldithrix sp.]|nr:ABC transporter ATP-binding protein [Caldithrix sp.]